jgi:hypothetical protein
MDLPDAVLKNLTVPYDSLPLLAKQLADKSQKKWNSQVLLVAFKRQLPYEVTSAKYFIESVFFFFCSVSLFVFFSLLFSIFLLFTPKGKTDYYLELLKFSRTHFMVCLSFFQFFNFFVF